MFPCLTICHCKGALELRAAEMVAAIGRGGAPRGSRSGFARSCTASASDRAGRASARSRVREALQLAVHQALPEAAGDRIDAQQADPRFGDYQSNAAMALFGRHIKKQPADSKAYSSPHELASAICTAVRSEILLSEHSPRADGPGFINADVSSEFLSSVTSQTALHGAGSLGQLPLAPAPPLAANRKRAVVDYSSPNVAKEMHVGHLRSTVIGDALANAIEECGVSVLRLNHVGDWGTQFGMLIQHLREQKQDPEEHSLTSSDMSMESLEDLYREAKERFDGDEDGFKSRAQNAVVQLQSGENEARSLWQSICDASRTEFQSVYDKLGVRNLHERGESFYNNMIPNVLHDLSEQSIAVEDNGALAVFASEEHRENPNTQPLVVRKSDGGYSYASTDLAALKHRVEEEQADWVVYVTDAGQAGHFEAVFSAARRVEWLRDNVRVEHAPFGLVLGEDGRRLKTRSGKAVRLVELLDEATLRAKQQLVEREAHSWMENEELDHAASALGIGAVKYADLRNNRKTDYQFSFDAMLDFRGDTAVYLQYAHVRICSILRKAGFDPLHLPGDAQADAVSLTTDEERALALHIARYAEAVEDCVSALAPNRICAYVYDLAGKFTDFYNACPILGSVVERERLTLAFATGHILRRCFSLLGITPLRRL